MASLSSLSTLILLGDWPRLSELSGLETLGFETASVVAILELATEDSKAAEMVFERPQSVLSCEVPRDDGLRMEPLGGRPLEASLTYTQSMFRSEQALHLF